MGQFSNSFPKHFSYLCEYAIRFDLSCSFCEYPYIFHCLHCSPSCFDPDSLLLAYLWLGLSWVDCISANKSFSSSKTSSRKPYTSSKQQERQKHSVEITINFSRGWRTPTARPVGGQSGEGERLTSDAPHNGGRHPPRGRPSATPTASNASPQGRTLWGRCWVPTPAPIAPGTHGSQNPGCPLQRTGYRGRDSA